MAEGTPEEQGPAQPSQPETSEPANPPAERSAVVRVAVMVGKVFVQGLVFAAFLLAITYVLAFGLLVLFASATLAGNNLALFLAGVLAIEAVFVIATGFVNSLLTQFLWFPVHKGWGAYILQGIVIVLTLSVVGIVPFTLGLGALPTLFTDPKNVPSFLVGNVILALFYGTVARGVGGHWRKTVPGSAGAPVITLEPPIEPSNPAGVHCPRCGSVNLVVAEDRSAYCIECHRGLPRQTIGGASS